MTRNYIVLSILIALAAVCVTTQRAAQASQETEIYVVDIQRVINESIEGRAARNNIETEIKKSEVRLAKMKSDLEKNKAELSKQAALLSPAAMEEKNKAVAK